MRRSRRTIVVAVLLLVVVAAGVGFFVVRRVSGTPQERYCDTLVSRRAELTDVLSGDANDVLLQALPIFEDLQQQAPRDLADEWQQVVSALRGLQAAVDDAGLDPATYDRDQPPARLTEAQREAIDQAATEVGGEQTRTALTGIDQQARDVCGTPLTQ